MYFYCSYFYIFCPYEFLELIEILFCSILNRIGPDMSRYYRNSVFRQTSRGLVSTLDFVKTRKYFYCSYFYILCPYEFIELNEILFRSILNRIGPDMSRYYRNSVFRQTSRGLVSTLDFVKTRKYFYCSYFYILCPYEFIELNEILFSLDSEPYWTRYEPILQELSFSTNLKEVSQYIGFCKNWNVFLLFIFLHFLSL